MQERTLYFDHNATTPVRPEVLEALLPFYRDDFGNPSSIYSAGRKAREGVDSAREQVAGLCACHPSEVIFTSCGSEADNMAIKGVAVSAEARGKHVIISSVEHPAVANSALYLENRGWRVTRIPVDADGIIDPEEVRGAIAPDTVLISVMLANNETGVISPVDRIGEIAAASNIPFHCDAVQGAGKIPFDFRQMGASLLALSGHKLYAPKGVGALLVRKGTSLHPLIHGGAQERNRRGGTENVAGIVAFGKACELAAAEQQREGERMLVLRRRLEAGVLQRIAGIRIHGAAAPRLPNTVCISFPGVRADSLLQSLDLHGVAASSGAACSSGTLRPSPVLAAMGISPEEAASSVRFSLGRGNTIEEVDRLLELLPGLVQNLQGASGLVTE